jgi:NAD(P)-dependent dehydrogenase (short-subunit alcohol dehydrogenase family)
MKASAIVTGGSGGLGTAVVDEMLAAGWRVVVPWVAEKELSRLPADEPRLETVRADLFNPDDVAAAVAHAAGAADAPLRAVVNLVGGFGIGGRVHETPVEEFEDLVRLNLRPLYLTTQAALPELIAGGGGSVVCVSSRAAVRPYPGAAGYVTGKAAVLALADALATEYKKDGVRVNTILPSVIDTPGNRAAQPGADYSAWVAPARVARVIRFLVEDTSDAVSGAHIPVYGNA